MGREGDKPYLHGTPQTFHYYVYPLFKNCNHRQNTSKEFWYLFLWIIKPEGVMETPNFSWLVRSTAGPYDKAGVWSEGSLVQDFALNLWGLMQLILTPVYWCQNLIELQDTQSVSEQYFCFFPSNTFIYYFVFFLNHTGQY